MSKVTFAKPLIIGIVILLLYLASLLILGLIRERTDYQEEAIETITRSSSHEQVLLAPVLVLSKTIRIPETDAKTKKTTTRIEEQLSYIFPEQLSVTGNAEVTPKTLGIYQAQTYQTTLNFSGKFGQIKPQDLSVPARSTLSAYIAVMIADPRGILNPSPFKLNDVSMPFEAGTVSSLFRNGLHIPLDIRKIKDNNTFSFSLNLQGTNSLAVVPIGAQSDFSLSSNWPHPSFAGTMLPQSHQIRADGFTAQWKSSWFANNLNNYFKNTIDNDRKMLSDSDLRDLPSFSVRLIETVNQYKLTERSVKYALLFIGLVFISFVLFEVIGKVQVHPVQYTLVGAALVLFYLVLLALSEHIGFLYAYISAALACSLLIGFYLITVLKGIKRSIGFTIGLLGLYGVLYIILQSDDIALLMGTGLLFIVLATVMILTRKTDWYHLNHSSNA